MSEEYHLLLDARNKARRRLQTIRSGGGSMGADYRALLDLRDRATTTLEAMRRKRGRVSKTAIVAARRLTVRVLAAIPETYRAA